MPLQRSGEGIPEDRITKILARAAEIDRATVSLETLRAAAIEAGISAAAVDQALEEYAAGVTQTVAPVVTEPPVRFGRIRRWFKKLRRPFRLATVAFALGIATAIGEALIPLALIVWVVLAIRYFLQVRKSGRTGTFQLTMFLMTISICFGNVVAEADADVLPVFLITGIALFVGGTALFYLGERDDALENSLVDTGARLT